MQNADAIQKKRLTAMFAIDVVCFVLAGAAIIGYVAFKQRLAGPGVHRRKPWAWARRSGSSWAG